MVLLKLMVKQKTISNLVRLHPQVVQFLPLEAVFGAYLNRSSSC